MGEGNTVVSAYTNRPIFFIPYLHISMGEGNTVVSAYTMLWPHPSI